MNGTFRNAFSEISKNEKIEKWRAHKGQHHPSSVLFSSSASSILNSRPPSAAYFVHPNGLAGRPRRSPSTSTLLPTKQRLVTKTERPLSVSTITRPASTLIKEHFNILKCGVCTEGFKFSSNFPCFDSYCSNCLQEHVLTFKRGTGCDCSLCKSGILLPSKCLQDIGQKTINTDQFIDCQSCTKPVVGKYRCNRCEQFFCEKCNRDFLKRMRVDSNSYFSNVPDLLNDYCIPVMLPVDKGEESFDSVSLLSTSAKWNELHCREHNEEMLRYFCKVCEKGICRDCKILKHEGHKTVSLEGIYEERKRQLAQTIELCTANLRKLHAESAEINSKRLDIDKETRDAIQLIEKQANEAKKMIDELSKSMVKTLREQNAQTRGKLLECREILKHKVKMLQALVGKSTEILESTDKMFLVKNTSAMTKSLNESDISSTVDRLWRKKYVFIPACMESISIRSLLGQMQIVVEGLTRDVPCIEIELQNSFNSDKNDKCTSALAPLSDDTIWVCNNYKNKIQRFSKDGQLIQYEILDFDVDDMVLDHDGQLLLTEFNGKLIRKLYNGKIRIFVRTDMYLRGINVNRYNDNIIACGNDVPVACLKDAILSKIYVVNKQGKTIKEILVDTGLKSVSLYRIVHTISDEYVVSTGISSLYFIIGVAGDLRYRFRTSSTADGVACDSHGLLYLTSSKDDTLYVIDSKGNPMPISYALNKPNSVAIDKNDVIWIGDWSKVHVLKCKA